jgi:hypothetical protein
MFQIIDVKGVGKINNKPLKTKNDAKIKKL